MTGAGAAGAQGGPGAGPAPKIRIVLVDDQELLRTGFRMILDAQQDMTVVGEAGDGLSALELLSRITADVVLMDVRMPALDGVETTRRLLDGRPLEPAPAQDDPSCPIAPAGPKVLILTTFDLDEYAFAAIKAGASGFMLKDAPPTELLSAIRAVHSGDAVVAPSTTRRLLDRFAPMLPDGPGTQAPGAASQAAAACLTDREREVLGLVAQGMSNTEIAARLVLSEATVKTHVGRILMKLELRDRVQAVVFAYETGLVRPASR
ncbi:MAG TPA: response regulator transcription factor [Actinocrinis sp.]|jgi:DNA-binding NarL/FixJ family response regulator